MKPEENVLWKGPVRPDWVDYNGHMNDAAYAQVFSTAVDELMVKLGIDSEFRNKHHYSIYTLETHLIYLDEAREGQELSVTIQLLDHDQKRLHVFFEMNDKENHRIATSEQMLMGMDTEEGRPTPFPAAVADAVTQLAASQEEMMAPGEAGRTIGIRKK